MTGSSRPVRSRRPRTAREHQSRHGHDGFTLADLVSYGQQTQRGQRRGQSRRRRRQPKHQLGRRGPTDDPAIIALRQQLRRNLLACLLLAQGVPLLLAGDEVGNSQNGNNNAYCQDNLIGWVDWSGLGRAGEDMCDLIAQLTAAAAPLSAAAAAALSRRPASPTAATACCGSTPQATEMTEQDWNFPEGRFLAYALGPLEQAARRLSTSCSTLRRGDRVHCSRRYRTMTAGACCSTPRAVAAPKAAPFDARHQTACAGAFRPACLRRA